jgi:CRP/FNR family transcriptional regulator, dissimilatory nitrate respiration regulator
MTTPHTQLRLVAIANTLRMCRLFAGLPPDDLSAIAAITLVKALEKGDYLFREADPSQGVFIVQKGALNIHRVNAMGKEQVIHIFRAGESFAEAALTSPTGYPADARAVESSSVLMVRKVELLGLLKRQPELALRMIASMSFHLRTLVSQLEDMTLKDVETRLANWLLKRCPAPESPKPATVVLGTSKIVLAAELGTISETLSRTLAKLRGQGLIEVKGKTFVLPCPQKLQALLRHNLGE